MIKLENLDFWIQNHYNVLLVGEHGVGKCLGKGTPVLMYNGEIKKVENIQLNDLLMGSDSKPRLVLSINQGREEMFRITPTKGDSFECNKSHILCLKMAGKNEVIEITLDDYLKRNKTFRRRAMLFRNSVNFSIINHLPQPAYLLGLWLGDGTSSKSQFTSVDLEILDYLCDYAKERNLFFKPSEVDGITYDLNSGPNSVGQIRTGRNEFLTFLKEFDLLNNKHIPMKYLTSS
jgi:replicative DNA helicase